MARKSAKNVDTDTPKEPRAPASDAKTKARPAAAKASKPKAAPKKASPRKKADSELGVHPGSKTGPSPSQSPTRRLAASGRSI